MSIIKKIKKVYLQNRLYSSILNVIKPYFFGVFHLFYNPGKKISIHNPLPIIPDSKDNKESEIVRRIFESFSKMKRDQKDANKIYFPSSLWQSQIDISFSYLNKGIKNNDIETFHYFLANFGSWPKYTGVTHSTLIHKYHKSLMGRRYLQNRFYNNMNVWKWFNEKKDISLLSCPQYGNQSGSIIDGHFIGFGSFFNEIYGSLLSELLSEIEAPIITELGGGCGIWSYFILRKLKNFCYLDFDLPETLCLAAYYLMKTFPDKKVLLYGEDQFSTDLYNKYDLIFLPNYEIEKIKNKNIDLFLNKNSLGEMHKDVVKAYLKIITNCSKYFFHMNHEKWVHTYEDGTSGVLASDYDVPKNKYKLLMRYPDLGHLIYDGGINYNHDIFFYLYEKK